MIEDLLFPYLGAILVLTRTLTCQNTQVFLLNKFMRMFFDRGLWALKILTQFKIKY